MDKPKLINFRCPDDVWDEISTIGGDRHPKGEDNFHLTATLLDILRAGIAGIKENPNILGVSECQTVSKTELQEAIAGLRDELREEIKKPEMAMV